MLTHTAAARRGRRCRDVRACVCACCRARAVVPPDALDDTARAEIEVLASAEKEVRRQQRVEAAARAKAADAAYEAQEAGACSLRCAGSLTPRASRSRGGGATQDG